MGLQTAVAYHCGTAAERFAASCECLMHRGKQQQFAMPPLMPAAPFGHASHQLVPHWLIACQAAHVAELPLPGKYFMNNASSEQSTGTLRFHALTSDHALCHHNGKMPYWCTENMYCFDAIAARCVTDGLVRS